MSLALPFEDLPGNFAALAVAFYQRHVSPWKGFACAHRVVRGGDSCSEHVRRVFKAEGLWAGLRAIGPRLRACREAARDHQDRLSRRALARSRGFDEYFDGSPGPAPQGKSGAKPPFVNRCDPGALNFMNCVPSGGDCSIDLPDCAGCDPPAVDCCG